MRINKFIAQATGMSRRKADEAIASGRAAVNGVPATLGQDTADTDTVSLDGQPVQAPVAVRRHTIMLNKPAGYVVSRNGQGSRTIYDLLPAGYHNLKPVGRLDKDSSGLLLLTDDGQLAHELTHPSKHKIKVYEVTLDKPLAPLHRQMISDHGIALADGASRLQLERLRDGDDKRWRVTMYEGRNRQIRRTFAALGYGIASLHRIAFGLYRLNGLRQGSWQNVAATEAAG